MKLYNERIVKLCRNGIKILPPYHKYFNLCQQSRLFHCIDRLVWFYVPH